MSGFFSTPPFRVGDEVEYELSWWGIPTWSNNLNRGPSGHWETAIVKEINDEEIVVVNECGKHYRWPNTCSKYYRRDQWLWDGYLRRRGGIKNITIFCQCGAHKTRNPNLHSHWCPKYE